MKKLTIYFFLFVILLVSKTSMGQDEVGMHFGANETFKYWAGEDPWEGIDVKNGQYWSSDHITKEYIMYMEVIVPKEMAQSFINDEYNKLELTQETPGLPNNAPEWFKPPKDFKVYKRGRQGSIYFIDTDTGYMFIYEVQL
jgi:hypothetical protein